MDEVGREVLVLTTDSTGFEAGVVRAEKSLASLDVNLRVVGTDLDKLAAGMNQAAKASQTSLSLIAGMSQAGAANLKALSAQTQSMATGARGMTGAFKQFDGVLGSLGVHIDPAIKAMGELGDVGSKSALALGGVATAGLALGAGIAGWKIGRLVSDFFDLDVKIGNATAKLLGWGDAAGAVAGAKQDVVTRAIERGAAATITYSDALKFNTDWMNKHNTAADAAAKTGAAWAQAMEQLTATGSGWKGTLNTMSGDTAEAVKYYLKAGVAQDVLANSYGLTDYQVKAVASSIAAETEAQKQATAVAAKAAEWQERWNEQQNDQADIMRDNVGVFRDFAKGLEQSRNNAKGFTAEGLIPIATELRNDARAAAEYAARLQDLNKQHLLLQSIMANRTVLTPGSGLEEGGNMPKPAAAAGGGILDMLKGLTTNTKQSMTDITDLFMSAFTGGGGAAGAVKAFATQATSSLLGLIPIVGPFLSKFAGPIVAGFQKIGSMIKGLFGGPSAEELAGRDVTTAFENNLAGMLTGAQRLEAGNEQWKMSVIAIRDAYLAQGLTAAQALTDTQALFDSSKLSASEQADIIQRITDNMAGMGKTATDVGDQVGAGFDNASETAEQMQLVTAAQLDEMAQSGKFSAEEMEEAYRAAALKIKTQMEALSGLRIDVPVNFQIGDFPGGNLPITPMEVGGLGIAVRPTLCESVREAVAATFVRSAPPVPA